MFIFSGMESKIDIT